MSYKIIERVSSKHPYEIVQIRVDEIALESIDDYLAIEVGVVEVIQNNHPFYIVKKVKDNIGMGK